jgi:hypothetical protein
MAHNTQAADRWVVCDDYAAGPYTEAAATQALARYDTAPGCPFTNHQVVVSATKPVTLAELRTMRAEWDNWHDPFLSGMSQELVLEARKAATRELAAAILTFRRHTPVGNLILTSAGWSREAADRANAAAVTGTPEWFAALGAYEHATLTEDGRSARRDAWCPCPEDDSAGTWVRYEYWTARGMEAHGYVCPECRRLTQAG